MGQAETKEWYGGATGEGVERDTLSTCGELPTEDKVRSGEEPFVQILETPAVEPMCRHKTGEKEGVDEEPWHDANKGEREMTCEEVEDGGDTERIRIGNRPDRGSIWLAFRFRWSMIRMWMTRLKQAQGAKNKGQAAEPDW